MPDSNSFTRSEPWVRGDIPMLSPPFQCLVPWCTSTWGWRPRLNSNAASRLRYAVDEILPKAVSCERAFALQLDQFVFTQADPVNDVNLLALRSDFARERDSSLGQFV